MNAILMGPIRRGAAASIDPTSVWSPACDSLLCIARWELIDAGEQNAASTRNAVGKADRAGECREVCTPTLAFRSTTMSVGQDGANGLRDFASLGVDVIQFRIP
jgi:hypothetical protein